MKNISTLENENIFSLTEKLILSIDKFDQLDRESTINLFSEQDPLENLQKSLVELLNDDSGQSLSECEQKASEIIDIIKNEIYTPKISKKLCASLRLLANDMSQIPISVISGILAGITVGGVITVPIAPVVFVSVGSLIIIRLGIEIMCEEYK